MVGFDNMALRAARKAKHLTQAELAEMADCEERYLRELETGRKDNPSFLLVYRLCDSLDIPLESLVKTVPSEDAQRAKRIAAVTNG